MERAMKNRHPALWFIIGYLTTTSMTGQTLASSAPDLSASAAAFRATAAGSRIRVAVGPTNRIRMATEGGSWLEQEAPTLSSLFDVAYGRERFVTVGNEGAVLTSSNGVNWRRVEAGTDERLRAVIFGAGMKR